MELSPRDKKLLFGGRCWIFTIFPKRKALKKINELIAEADQLLGTYPAVNYNNFGVMIDARPIEAALLGWNVKVVKFFAEIFKDQLSDVQARYIHIVGNNPYGDYLTLRDTLDKKRAYLIEFQQMLTAL